LAVPGSSERFLKKAAILDVDMVLLDLEDAVAPDEKPAARNKVAHAIREYAWGDKIVGVRLNAFSSLYTVRDMIEVIGAAGPRLDVVILAKTRDAHEIAAIDLLLTQLEAEAGLENGQVGIEALIESADGLANITEIAAASSRLEAIAFGPGDLAASLGIPMGIVGDIAESYPGDHFHAVCLALLLAARTHGLQVIDGPYLGLQDIDRLREMSLRTRALGFDGKWAIHPDQLATINEVFSPTETEIARAHEMLVALELAATSEGKGAIRHGDEMFDEVNRKMALATLSRAHRMEPGDPR
jgi:citrate lyase subunit beta/citryl-CoA lyase